MEKEKNINQEFVKKNKMPKWVIVIIVVLSVFIALPMLIFIGLVMYIIVDSEINHGDVEKDLLINNNITSLYDEEYGTYVVSGYVTNTGENDYYNVVVSYSLYDENNNIIGEATDYLSRLKDSETWSFAAEYYGIDAQKVARIEFDEITAVEDEFWD